jgi:hypothetical protein
MPGLYYQRLYGSYGRVGRGNAGFGAYYFTNPAQGGPLFFLL